MKICVFLSSYEGSGCVLEEVNTIASQPGRFTSQHEFEYRWIHKHKAEQQINDAVAEGFDFYFNFLWGTPHDDVAGADASRYFESLDLPSCGIHSSETSQTKNVFYDAARLHGAPRVPGVERFPLFVKPGFGCSSQLIDERSVCRNQDELESALHRMHEALHEPRMKRATALGIEDPIGYVRSLEAAGRSSEDIVVQEYIEGQDYGCVVVQLGPSCVALTPVAYRVKKPLPQKEQFITFEGKFDEGTYMELLRKEDDATLFENIQQASIEAFAVRSYRKNITGCNVDLRATPDGQVFVIELNPQPAEFVPAGLYEDIPVTHSFPGGLAALIDVYIANYLLRHSESEQNSRRAGIASAYDDLATDYDHLDSSGEFTVKQSLAKLVGQYDFSGTILDLACGTGVVGQILAQSQKYMRCTSSVPTASQSSFAPPTSHLNGTDGTKEGKEIYRLLGCDISSGMLDVCRDTGFYDSLDQTAMHSALMNLTEPIDHVVCSSALQHIEPEMFSFIMVLLFVRARKSITLSVEDIPDVYNEKLLKAGLIKAGAMAPSSNHLGAMEAFGVPERLGWQLVSKERVFSWASPKTGDRIYATWFRFERADDGGLESYTMFKSAI
ncbi:hypothetical protein E4U13_007346 [Claviceps humidiphila]|uniref:D-alanine--D-alanine ligase C-terminal domain-containing protein n=1 Tax=Claviceps humidiphila TaxID=1294629 RepID=A0A9P7Q5V0_9HYPO|nr:hypothetical protein E4U13_007346 [Claviceps humidiphila]